MVKVLLVLYDGGKHAEEVCVSEFSQSNPLFPPPSPLPDRTRVLLLAAMGCVHGGEISIVSFPFSHLHQSRLCPPSLIWKGADQWHGSGLREKGAGMEGWTLLVHITWDYTIFSATGMQLC
ncbi:hypothetical protein BX600DRAFT_92732 [Xylariales sp. PMI_506]|nr:hypothetical protein BX600DRAFT_92732 [Xylariales sp. PMI_506]